MDNWLLRSGLRRGICGGLHDKLLLVLLLILLLDSTRLDIRIKSQEHDCNGKAEPKEPQ